VVAALTALGHEARGIPFGTGQATAPIPASPA
jgi:hypothetical protein